MSKKIIYLVKGRPIRAISKMAAVCYAARFDFPATIPTQEELIALVKNGVEIEDASAVKEDALP